MYLLQYTDGAWGHILPVQCSLVYFQRRVLIGDGFVERIRRARTKCGTYSSRWKDRTSKASIAQLQPATLLADGIKLSCN